MNEAVSPERLDAWQRDWVRLLDGFGVAAEPAYAIFDRLVERHSEPHRKYHTLEHVGEVLRVLGRLSAGLENPAPTRLAAWFHDAIYDPRSSTNEADSAKLLQQSLAPLGVPQDILARAGDLVRLTDHQRTPVAADEIALIDADLAILAAAPNRYRRYAEAIRQEYAWVDDEAYRRGRIAVLETFLNRPRIFQHPYLFAEGEAAARDNLRAEIETLRGVS